MTPSGRVCGCPDGQELKYLGGTVSQYRLSLIIKNFDLRTKTYSQKDLILYRIFLFNHRNVLLPMLS